MTLNSAALPLTLTQRIGVDRLDARTFRSAAHPGPSSRSYGGEVAAQAIHAAGLTVPEDRGIHSAHTWFLLPGDTALPVDYRVRDVRDGGSFTTRSVDAVQGDRVIFTMTASFQKVENGLEHQVGEVHSPAPEELLPPEQMLPPGENLRWVQNLQEMSGFDLRFPEPPARSHAALGDTGKPHQKAWLRAGQSVPGGDLQQAAGLAYASDMLLLSTALGPHRRTLQTGMQFATVNHTIWFHHPMRVDEWFFYDMSSRWAGSGRALCHGEIFDRSGRLCASITQEGLLRLR